MTWWSRPAVATRADGGEELLVRDSGKGAWRTLTGAGPTTSWSCWI